MRQVMTSNASWKGSASTSPAAKATLAAPRSPATSLVSRPTSEVTVRLDVLEEIDRPMLQHGLQGFQGRRIHVPRADHRSSGSSNKCVDPSARGCGSSYRSWPWEVSDSRSSASGGRKRYRQYADRGVMRTRRPRGREER